MKIFLVRHGQSVGNIRGLTQGQADFDLTTEGIEQAKKVANRLKKEVFGKVYSSDLMRVIKTRDEILKFHPEVVKPTELKVLRERPKGIFEGEPREKLIKAVESAEVSWMEYVPEGGESVSKAYDKLKKFCSRIKKEAQKENILVVSHGGPISFILMHMLGEPVEKYSEYIGRNSNLSVLEVEKDKVNLVCFDCLRHLGPEKDEKKAYAQGE